MLFLGKTSHLEALLRVEVPSGESDSLRLWIQRSQGRFLIAPRFILEARCFFSEAEHGLIESYRLRSAVIFRYRPEHSDQPSIRGLIFEINRALSSLAEKEHSDEREMRLWDMAKGIRLISKDITDMLGYEEAIRDQCEKLKEHFKNLQTYNDEEIISYEPDRSNHSVPNRKKSFSRSTNRYQKPRTRKRKGRR